MLTRRTVFCCILVPCLAATACEARFLQTDPAGPKVDPNLYTYVSNDPLNKRDPKGDATVYDYPGQSVIVQTYDNSSQIPDAQIDAQGANLSGTTSSGRKVFTVLAPGQDSDTAHIRTDSKLNDNSDNPLDRSHTDQIGGRNVELAPNIRGPITVGHELGHVTGGGDQYVGGVDANGNVIKQAPANSPSSLMKDLGGPANAQTLDEMIAAPTNKHLQCTTNVFESNCK